MALQGIMLTNNFKQTRTEFDSMIKHINDIASKPINITVNVNSVQQQIKQVSQQISEMSKITQSNIASSIVESIPNSDKLSKALEQAQRGLNINLQGLKTKYGSLLPSDEVVKLENSIKNLNATDMGTLRTSVKDIRLDMSQMTANAKDSSSALRIANQDAKSFGATLMSDATKFGLWMVIGTMIMQPIRAIEQGIVSVKELDDTLNDLQMDMMSTSKGAFNNLVTSSRNLSISLGTNIKDIDTMMKVYSNANTSVDEIMKKTSAASILTNISDMGAKDSVDAIQSIMLQFDQFKNSTNSLSDQANHINDVLASVAQSLNTDFKTGIQNISEAVKVSGEVINEAGMSYEKYASIVGKVAEVSRLSGSTIGNAMKTIASRIGRANKGDVSAEEVSVIDKAYQSIGISIRKSNGEFEDLDTTLTSLSKVWGNLNNVQRSYIAEQSAGVRQKSIFINMMNNYAETTNMATDALNNQGLASEKNAVYLDSLTAKITILKNELTAMWQNGLNSNIFKSMIDGTIDLVQNFGNLHTVISLTATGLALFKGKDILDFFTNLPTKIKGSVTSMQLFKEVTLAMQMQEAGMITFNQALGFSFTALGNSIKTAFLNNPLGWIALGVTGIVMAVDKFNNSVKDQIDNFDKVSSGIQKEIDSVNTLKGQLNTLDELHKKGSLNNDDKEKLKSINNDLSQQYPQLISYYDSETKSFQVNTEKLAELIKKKQELAMEENANNLQSAKDASLKAQNAMDEANAKLKKGTRTVTYKDEFGYVNTSEKDLSKDEREKLINSIKENQSLLDKSNQTINQGTMFINNYINDETKLGTSKDNINKKLMQYGYTQNQINDAVAQGTDTLAQNTQATNDNSNSKDKNKSKTEEQGNSFKSLSDIQKDLADAMSKARTEIDECNSVLEKHAQTGEWDLDTIIKLSGNYPQLLGLLGDDKALEQEIIKIKGDKVKATQDSLNSQLKLEVDYLNSMTDGYNFDMSNFATAQEAKTYMLKSSVNKRIALYERELNAAMQAFDAAQSVEAKNNALRGAMTAGENLSMARADVDYHIDRAYMLQRLSSSVGNYMGNIGSSNYDGKKNPVDKSAEEAAKKAEQARNDAYQAIDDINKKLMDSIKQQVENEKKALDERLKNYENFINDKLKALDNEYTTEDRQRKLAEEKKKKEELQAQQAELLLDSSDEARNRRYDLQQQIDTQQQAIDDLNRDYSREDRKANLQNQLDAYQKQIEQQKQSLDNKYTDAEIARMANAGLNGALITVGNQSKTAKQMLIDAMISSGDAFTVAGQKLQTELIDKLVKVQQLVANMDGNGNISGNVALNIMGSHKDGGIVTYQGLSVLHGSSNNPEIVLNGGQQRQLADNIWKMATKPIPMPKVDINAMQRGNGNITLKIDSIIGTVQGSVDKSTLPLLERLIEEKVPQIVANAQVNNDKRLGSYRPRLV